VSAASSSRVKVSTSTTETTRLWSKARDLVEEMQLDPGVFFLRQSRW
jgi:hypothetical protein